MTPIKTTPPARYWATFLVANSLSLGRLLAGLAFPWFSVAWRPPIVLAAAASDMVDGAVSRRFGGTSAIGQLLDPIADKTFLLMVIGTFWMEGSLALWQIALLGLREWVVLSIALLLILMGKWQGVLRMAPRWSGKVATAAQFAYLAGLLFLQQQLNFLFQLAVAMSGLAAADYLIRARALFRAVHANAKSVDNSCDPQSEHASIR